MSESESGVGETAVRVGRAIVGLFAVAVIGAVFAPQLSSFVGSWTQNITNQGGPTSLAAPIVDALLGPVLWLVIGIFAVVGAAETILMIRDRSGP